MKQIFLILTLLFTVSAFADETCDETPAVVKDVLKVAYAAREIASCPNGTYLPNLCTAIGDRLKETDGRHEFYYQKIVNEAACVLPGDSEAVASGKIQNMWRKFPERLICNNGKFEVRDGNVLKYAVSSRFEDFLFDAAYVWKVDLNKVDASDNRTVLDYVRYEIEKNKGNPIERTLRSYYDTLQAAGAKHKSEL